MQVTVEKDARSSDIRDIPNKKLVDLDFYNRLGLYLIKFFHSIY